MATVGDAGWLDDRERFDLDHVVRVRERSDLDHRGGRALLTEHLVTHDAKVEPIANVGDISRDLHDVGDGAATRLDERPDRTEHRARLASEVAAMLHGA